MKRFTLIELLVILAILFILGAMLSVALQRAKDAVNGRTTTEEVKPHSNTTNKTNTTLGSDGKFWYDGSIYEVYDNDMGQVEILFVEDTADAGSYLALRKTQGINYNGVTYVNKGYGWVTRE